MSLFKMCFAAGLLLPCISTWGAWTDQVTPSRDDFGGMGLMQMPSARMAPEGDMSINYSRIDPYVFGTINMQPLSWFNASIRYVDITNRLYGPEELSGSQSYKDKGIDIKLRLWEESYYLPDISLGFQDLGGTGLFSSEFINATKRIGPFDITLGVAWGYLGAAGDISNPACMASDRFCERTRDSDNGGSINTSSFFSGDGAAVFAGVEYQTPWQPLTLKLEYDGNDYQSEPLDNNLEQDSRFNIGASLKVTDSLDLQLAYERGNTLAFGVTFHGNVITDVVTLKHDPEPIFLKARPAVFQGESVDYRAAPLIAESSHPEGPVVKNQLTNDNDSNLMDVGPNHPAFSSSSFSPAEVASLSHSSAQTKASRAPAVKSIEPEAKATNATETDWDQVANQLANNAGLAPTAIYQSEHSLTIIGSQTKYRDRKQADERIAAIAYNATDENIGQFKVIEEANGLAQTETQIGRAAFIEQHDHEGDFNQAPSLAYVTDPQAYQGEEVWSKPYDPLSFSLTPGMNQSVGGPDGFFLYQVILKGGATLQLTDNFSFSGSISANMLNNYDNFKYDAPSNLPRVRTYIREYLTTSDFGVNDLQATWFGNPAKNWYTQVYGGYLEYMYGGVGGEILYRPLGSRWAIGADLDAVKQRDFDQRFGFRDYQTVLGHINLYYQSPWDGVSAELNVGRYLAKDDGATLTVTREFSNGFRIGAYATMTNVSSEDYGEGSFTKGVFMSFPFDQITTSSTVKRGSVGWTPLTRDGGQKLIHKYSLYDMTEQRGYYEYEKR
ncbi:YjbH domain-containing protein [Marinomonas arenicola]|uniref:YjbH domain-containing protein n=1 Tax=Marinomonas arenicola TaxID=569601 RepID=A0ABU9G5L7_9GAMM